jgi:hypothetical protein
MTKVAAATLQTLWDCRWSRPASRLTNTRAESHPASVWMCIRAGGRRAVTEQECERCEFWEATDIISERDERG